MLLDVLDKLVDKGNTVVVIEHNPDVIWAADHLIDLGPEGGDGGGTVVVAGSLHDVMQCEASHTGAMLREMAAESTRGQSARGRPSGARRTRSTNPA